MTREQLDLLILTAKFQLREIERNPRDQHWAPLIKDALKNVETAEAEPARG
jgi:hypothetical protein